MKKKRILIILAVIIILIAIIFIVRSIINANKPKETIDDFSSVKELIEYDGHEYLGMKNSEEEGFEKDIYIKFSKPPINDDGTTNEGLYEVVINHVARKMKGQNFRLIDADKNIVIKIQYNENEEINLYTINDDAKYWEHIKTYYQIDEYEGEKVSSFTITSSLLANIINNNWIYNNINLGNRESTEGDYEIYENGDYKVRKIGQKIYNIVFTKNYQQEIINGISTSTDIETVENILGEPTYKDDNYDIIGYKCEYFYIFLNGKEISIYHPDEYNEEDSKEFGTLVTELNKTGDIDTFFNKLTDLYPDYGYYSSNNNYVDIVYPLRGFSVKMGYPSGNGIVLYSNFQGWITEDLKIEDLIDEKKLPANVYTRLDRNLILEAEAERISNEMYLDSGEEEDGGEL